MKHLILGYGYCGYYLAQELLNRQQEVIAVSRNLKQEFMHPELNHITHDLNHTFIWDDADTTIYYLIPPSSQGNHDIFLKQFLHHSRIKARKIIYFGSSGVYGNHNGEWVNEDSSCIIDSPRQLRRLDAEQQWQNYCRQHRIEFISLRIAGIIGPGRIGLDAARNQTPLIEKTEAPLTNHIYVKDLCSIAVLIAESSIIHPVINVANGNPLPMGTLQEETAKISGLKKAPRISWSEAWESASPMKREFMNNSKKINIGLLKKVLGNNLVLTSITDAIKYSL